MRRCFVFFARFAVLAGLVAAAAFASGPVDVYEFDNDEQRSRYKALIAEFRCPKCLNTNIAGSDAPIAQDLRRTVHRLVVAEGFSNEQVKSYLQERYGDFVLYRPPLNARTWLIWVLPALLVLCGVAALVALSGRARRREAALDAADRERLAALVDHD